MTRNPSEMGQAAEGAAVSARLAARSDRASRQPIRAHWRIDLDGTAHGICRRRLLDRAAQIIWLNIMLSGDNAVVIALAARSLPPHSRSKAIFWGSARRGRAADRADGRRGRAAAAAVPARSSARLLLLWIGVQLLVDDDEDEGEVKAAGHAWLAAIRTILHRRPGDEPGQRDRRRRGRQGQTSIAADHRPGDRRSR